MSIYSTFIDFIILLYCIYSIYRIAFLFIHLPHDFFSYDYE